VLTCSRVAGDVRGCSAASSAMLGAVRAVQQAAAARPEEPRTQAALAHLLNLAACVQVSTSKGHTTHIHIACEAVASHRPEAGGLS